MGWQGRAVDVEIECHGGPPRTWAWTLYDRERPVAAGVTRSEWRAQVAGWWATIRYLWFR
jgi:hypothetical protein